VANHNIVLRTFGLCADQSVAEAVRPRSAGNRCTIDTAVVDVGPVGHNVLYRKRRVLHRRRGHRGAHFEAWSHGARGLPTGRCVEGWDRGKLEKRIQVDTQLQDTVGQNRIFRQNAEQH